MQKFVITISAAILVLMQFTACAAPARTVAASGQGADARPAWYFNPSLTGKAGGVGMCKAHINGTAGQRDLAIRRAIDELAKQMGVKVQNAAGMFSSGTSDSAVTHKEEYSLHTVDGVTVRAVVKELWLDSKTGELYVWMVAE
jgi:maltose-binding protein MalE